MIITGIPSGVSCTVTETSKSAAPAGYVWGSAVIMGSPASITSGGNAQAGITNPLSVDSGALTIGFWQKKNGEGIIKNYGAP